MIYKKRSVKVWKKIIKGAVLDYFKNKNPYLSEQQIILLRVYRVERIFMKGKFKPFYIANVIIYVNQDFRIYLRLQISTSLKRKKFKFKILEEYRESSVLQSLRAIARAREDMKKNKTESKKYIPCLLSAEDLRRRMILLSS